jgi:uncharacterized protein (TIGR02996 family)
MLKPWIKTVTLIALLVPALPASAQVSPEFCGVLKQRLQAGPWDYRTQKEWLPLVEEAHFLPQTERLERGTSGHKVGGDFDYTLNKFPNHARALLALVRLSQRYVDPREVNLPRPVECYFERAIRFAKDDLVVRMIYARWLDDQKRRADALKQLDFVAQQGKDNPVTLRSLGLISIEMGEFDRARQYAWALEDLVPGTPALREPLQKAGQWRDKPEAPAAPASEAASR